MKAIEAAPERAAIRKDMAYACLKAGENDLAREQFSEAMRLDPADFHVALEYAFLCFETKEKALARRIFDRIRREGDPQSRATAERAFRSIDGPLETGIRRWKEAIALGGDTFSAHYELAGLAEQRDELELAAEHYEAAWRLLPDRRSVLVDLGRVWKALNRREQAAAALLAASRGGEPRAAEAARELLPARYPWVPEFRAALALDPSNAGLRRELAYLLLRMNRQGEAEEEFRAITRADESDLLAAAQLGFLYLARGDRLSAMPLLERVLRGGDEELANRVRAVLRLPQIQERREASPGAAAASARQMAERSIRAGYMKDALRYLQMAHEADPMDGNVILKLGWTYNILRQDDTAARWFALARKTGDPQVTADAGRAWRNLRPALARFRTSVWAFPFYSSRWRDLFSYGQVRTDVRVPFPVQPYVSARIIGDTRGAFGAGAAQSLSESAVILALGLSTPAWRGLTGWGEAGSAYSYREGRITPDYRGGVAWFRGFGQPLGAERAGWFAEASADGVFVSRFGDDVLFYAQNRLGITPAPAGALPFQLYLNANITADTKRQYWANFVEAGPGMRFRWPGLAEGLTFSVNLLRGVHTDNRYNPRRPNYFDLRAGFGYAFRY